MIQLELDLVWERPTEWTVYNRFTGDKQTIHAFSRRAALLIAYAFSVGRESGPMAELYEDYADDITYDYCRVRLGDWCIGL